MGFHRRLDILFMKNFQKFSLQRFTKILISCLLVLVLLSNRKQQCLKGDGMTSPMHASSPIKTEQRNMVAGCVLPSNFMHHIQ